ncbi:MAG: DUF6273 domain-containing protein [Oscillospiraceae bacterium]|nr:DUF6273 domain-containing protein [Oscillospiraceae bacterium]
MASLSALEALRVLTVYIKTYYTKALESGLQDIQEDVDLVVADYETLKSEIAAIVSSAGDDNTEIVDARVAQGGTIYDSLGAHIRAIATGDALVENCIKTAYIQDGSITVAKLSEEFSETFYTATQVDEVAENAAAAAVATVEETANNALTTASTANETADTAAATAAAASTTAANAQTTANTALTTANNAYTNSTAAVSDATAAIELANSLAEEVDDLSAQVENGTGSSGTLSDINSIGLTEEDGKVYIIDTATGEHGTEGWEIPTGTGSGSSSSAKLKLTSGTTATIAEGTDYTVAWTFSSTDSDGDETGDGTGVLTLNGTVIYQASIAQGSGSYVISSDLLELGSNSLSFSVTDADGNTLNRSATVKVVALSISSTFDDSTVYSGDVTYRYTPVGSGITKTIHFVLDGVEIDTVDVPTTGRQQSYTIPEQTHGSHTWLVYATATIDGATATSNELYYEIGWVDESASDIIIASSFRGGEVTEGDSVSLSYLVYDPSSSTASVTRKILDSTGAVYYSATATVDRTQQTWTINDYPTGEITLQLICGSTVKEFTLTVDASDIDITPTVSSQVYYLSATSRTNSDNDRETADYGSISGTLSNFNYASDGWMGTTLRFQGDDILELDYKPLSTDIRSSGMTLEFEFTPIAVRDKDAVIISCMSGGVGFEITPQSATLTSEQSTKTINFSEDYRTRITIAVESTSEDRMVRLCVDGVPYGTFQYPAADNFQQTNPVGITIGNEDCSFDLHTIRLHTSGLTDQERINNWIYDRDTYSEKAELAAMNDVYDDYGQLSRTKVQDLLPCMYVTGTESTGKKDYQDVAIDFVHSSDTARNFTDSLAYWYVQGTSSVGFPVKNWRIQLSGEYLLFQDGEGQTLYCLKANFMDSSGACNTGTANMFNYIYRQMGYLTPPMEADENVLMCIKGYPIILWHRDTEDEEYEFAGIYTFNYDKGSGSEVLYGADEDSWPGVQWWEFGNNTSAHCLFQSADIDDDISTDLEVRYGAEDWTIISNAIQFVIDCAGDTAKFAAGVEDYFNLNYLLLYYVLSETLGCSDSRAKNMVMGVWPSVSNQLYALWYDIDTQAGRNNEGLPQFPYDMEAHSQYGTAMAFNGEASSLWTLVQDTYEDNEIKTLYQTLRSKGYLSLDTIKTYMIEPFYGSIPASLYVEDGVYKYERPTLEDGDDQLVLEQGDWARYYLRWVMYSLAYRDSKYSATQYTSDTLSLRIYSPTTDNITDETTKALVEASLAAVPPDQDFDISCDIHYYAGVLYGANGYQVQAECEEGGSVHITAPSLSNYNDLETYVQGIAWVTDVGDLSTKYPGSINCSAAKLLRYAYFGNRTKGFYNTNLTSAVFGNNVMMEIVVLSNSPNLTGNIDLSNCPAVEEFYAEGTSITSVTFSNGGRLKICYLPGTITNFTLLNQPKVDELVFEDYSSIVAIRIENCPTVDTLGLIEAAENLARVRLTDVDWTMNDSTVLVRLAKLGGLDANGTNTDVAVVTGKAYIDLISPTNLANVQAAFPDLELTYGSLQAEYTLTFENYDGSFLTSIVVEYGQDGYDPVASGDIPAPTKDSDVGYDYTFVGWSGSYTSVTEDRILTAVYQSSVRTYTVIWKNGATVAQTNTVEAYGSCSYTGMDLVKTGYIWTGWDGTADEVVSDMAINATYIAPSLPSGVLDTSEYDYAYSDDEDDSSAYTFGELIAIINAGLASTYLQEYDQIKLVPDNSVIKDTSIVFEWVSTGHYELADGSGGTMTDRYMVGLLTASRQMNSSNTNVGGWDSSAMRSWLNDALFPSLPPKWRNVIKQVNVLANAGDQSSDITTSVDYLHLLSTSEVGFDTGSVPYCNEVWDGANEIAFSKYTSNSARIKYTYNGTGTATTYWTRSAESSGSVSFRNVNTGGGSNSYYAASNSYGVCVGFSI